MDSIKIKEFYEDGICPHCGEEIPDDMVEGGECSNCGYVFWISFVSGYYY